jgi:hypothetical protein
MDSKIAGYSILAEQVLVTGNLDKDLRNISILDRSPS